MKGWLVIAFLSSLTVIAQNEFLQIEVSSASVEKGDVVSISIKSSGKGDLIHEFPDEFEERGTPLSGMSSNVKVINGKSIVEQYSFLEYKGVFNKTGKFKIGPFELQTATGTIQSNTVTIEVTKSINMISADPRENLDQAIFGILQQSKDEVYLGEAVVVEAKVYAQIDILQVDNFDSFNYEGPAQKVDVSNQHETKRNYEQIEGRQVMTFDMGRTVYYPELDGTFEISPFEMLLLYDDPRRLFPERAKIRSNESMIKVKPLPSNAPKGFNGAVGDYNISASVDREKVKQGKVIAYTLEVSGKGNIENLELPKIQFPKGVMLYGDPEIEDSVLITRTGIVGKKRITYFLQLNKSKDLELSPLELVFFNPETENYESKFSDEISIEVEPDANVADLQVATPKSEGKEDKERRSFLPEKKSYRDSYIDLFDGWTSTTWSYPLMLSFVMGLFWRVKKTNDEKNRISPPAKKIGLKAFRALTDIETTREMKDEEFFQSLKRVMDDFLTDKYGLNRLDITREYLKNAYAKLGLSEDDKAFLIKLYDYADSARFGMIGDKIEKQEWLDQGHELIQKLNGK
jgi:hypothetical protein